LGENLTKVGGLGQTMLVSNIQEQNLLELVLIKLGYIEDIVQDAYVSNDVGSFVNSMLSFYDELNLFSDSYYDYEDISNNIPKKDVGNIIKKYKSPREMLMKSLEYAFEGHKSRFRDSGKPYLNHVIMTSYISATILSYLKNNSYEFARNVNVLDTVRNLVEANLHDLLEEKLAHEKNFDYEAELEKIEKMFGKETREFIYSLTPEPILDKSERDRRLEEKILNYRKKYYHDNKKLLELDIIKLSDTIANVLDIEGMKAKYNLSADERKRLFLREKLPVAYSIAKGLDGMIHSSDNEGYKVKHFVMDVFFEASVKIGYYDLIRSIQKYDS